MTTTQSGNVVRIEGICKPSWQWDITSLKYQLRPRGIVEKGKCSLAFISNVVAVYIQHVHKYPDQVLAISGPPKHSEKNLQI